MFCSLGTNSDTNNCSNQCSIMKVEHIWLFKNKRFIIGIIPYEIVEFEKTTDLKEVGGFEKETF